MNNKINTNLYIFFSELIFINLISYLFKNEISRIIILFISLFLFYCSIKIKSNNENNNPIKFYGFIISTVLFFILFKLL